MRTTVNIDDGLLETAKRQAQAQRKTLGEFIESSLRREIFVGGDAMTSRRGELPVFRHGTGPVRGVDLTTNAGLYAAMYAEEDARYAVLARDVRP